MNDARTSAEVDHIRDLARRRLAVALLAIAVFCGASSVYAQATQVAPVQSPQRSTCAPETNSPRTDVAKHAVKSPTNKDAGDSKCPATSKQQPADNGAQGMLLLLLEILLTPRHGT